MSTQKFQEWGVEQIKKSGPIRLSNAMSNALIHPDFGYYHSQDIIGKKGDFITAPEISQMFGELIAAFLGFIWDQSGRPSNALLCELGPGRGTLSADIHSALHQIYPDFADAPLHLIEASQTLQEHQKATLIHPSIDWHDSFTQIPPQPSFIIANEFFDALGVDQAIFDGVQWRWRLLDFTTQFELVTGPVLNQSEFDAFNCISVSNPTKGTVIESSLKSEEVTCDIAHHIKNYGGACLIIDYGKNNPIGDTIQAVSSHKPVEPWSSAGNADISHWVDFSAIKRLTEKSGARFIGPVSQSHFLSQIGIKQRAERLGKSDNPEHNRALFAAVDRLISPAHMGNLFQVGLIVPTGKGLPPGFQPD